MISEKIEELARYLSGPESPVLRRLNRETQAKVIKPRMLSGHLQGKILEIISMIHKPRRILELGTFTGYSAICLAQGLTEDGVLHTIDSNPELEDFARFYFKEAGLEYKIIQHIGNALQVIPSIHDTFDLVYIDADKENYINYFEMVINQMPSGGIILADNIIWGGKIFLQSPPEDSETQSIIRFNRYISNHSGVDKLLIPYRDGLILIRKK